MYKGNVYALSTRSKLLKRVSSKAQGKDALNYAEARCLVEAAAKAEIQCKRQLRAANKVASKAEGEQRPVARPAAHTAKLTAQPRKRRAKTLVPEATSSAGTSNEVAAMSAVGQKRSAASAVLREVDGRGFGKRNAAKPARLLETY